MSLPSYLREESEDIIMQRMLDRIPDDIDKEVGSYIWDALAPAAIELSLASIRRVQLFRQIWATTVASDVPGEVTEALDLHVQADGMKRRSAQYATAPLAVVAAPGTVLPAVHPVSTVADEVNPPIIFKVVADIAVGETGMAEGAVLAMEAGRHGNVPALKITYLYEPCPGVIELYNPTPATGGLDIEDDISLLGRYLQEARKDVGAGNRDDYITWAQEVPGVGNVLVEPLWNGDGTVMVVILATDGRPAPAEIVEAVQEHIDPGGKGLGEGRAPVGARVTVVTAGVYTVGAYIPGLTAESGYTIEQARINAELALYNYLMSTSPGGTIRIKEVEAAITNATGVLDLGDILLNGARANIVLETDRLTELGSVTYG